MYIEAILKGYKLIQVPDNMDLRKSLESKSNEELVELLSSLKPLHNTTDTEDRKRLIRAIEIETFNKNNPDPEPLSPTLSHQLFGISFDRPELKKRITERLKIRLKEGMIEEVETLINQGVNPDSLKFYGMEYKFITQYLLNELSYNDMFQKLNSAIHKFAKRQMTWYRRMEKQGFKINWIDGNKSTEEKLKVILSHSF